MALCALEQKVECMDGVECIDRVAEYMDGVEGRDE